MSQQTNIVNIRTNSRMLILIKFNKILYFRHVRSSSSSHENLAELKRSKPIFAQSPKTPDDYLKYSSAPLEVITETPRKIQHEPTLVSMEGQPGPSSIKKKFIVTPAHDQLM